MAQPTGLRCVFVAMLALAGPATSQTSSAAQPAPVPDNVVAADVDAVTRGYPAVAAVADGCNARHRAFAREAPVIKR